MKAEIISSGTELLLGQITNTNARYIAEKLAELGIDVYYHITVGDNASRLRSAIEQAASRSDIIIITGGLGPTDDDLTRETVAEVIGKDLEEDPEVRRKLEEFFANLGIAMPGANLKQAMVIPGSIVIPNRKGTAPGMIVRHGAKSFILLPGPPAELEPMFDTAVWDYLRGLGGPSQAVITSRVLKICGIGESQVEEMIRDIVRRSANPTVAPMVVPFEVHLRITAKAPSLAEARRMISRVEADIRDRLGNHIYGADDDSLEAAVGRLLASRGLTLAVAESCTGGELAARLTDVPGSSEYFELGVVAYREEQKVQRLGVDPHLIAAHGAVSAEVAGAMASRVRELAGTHLGIGITGIAGPTGAEPEKPVGTVFIGLSAPDYYKVWRRLLWGSRKEVKERGAQVALVLLRRYLMGPK